MNFTDALTREHSRRMTDAIVHAIGNDPEQFKKIIDILYNAPAPLPQRASWILVVVSEQHSELIKPYIGKFIDSIRDFKIDGIKRNMMHSLVGLSIPKKWQGKLIDICFDFLISPNEKLALKVHSMQIIANHCIVYPELLDELKAVIKDQEPKSSAGFSARVRLIRKQLKF
jgi:hypothetical protein